MLNSVNVNNLPMKKTQKVYVIESSTSNLLSNVALKPSVTEFNVEQCKRIITERGIYPLPIAGKLPDSKMVIVHGQDEVDALRQLGATKVSTLVIDVQTENELNKLSLQLLQRLNTHTGLSEAILVEKLHSTGKYSLNELATNAGKSKSRICKMIKMVERISPQIIELVSQNKLSVRMAINISKLPRCSQYQFTTNATNSLISQCNIEKIITVLTSDKTPEDMKKIIIDNPSAGIEYIAQLEQCKSYNSASDTKKPETSGTRKAGKSKISQKTSETASKSINVGNVWFEIRFIQIMVLELENRIAQEIMNLSTQDKNILKELNFNIKRLYKLIDECVNNNVAHGQ